MEQLKDQTSTPSNNLKFQIMEIMEIVDTFQDLNPKKEINLCSLQ